MKNSHYPFFEKASYLSFIKPLLIIVMLFCLNLTFVNSQNDCGFASAMQADINANSGLGTTLSDFNEASSGFQPCNPPSGIFEIPVVVHIIHSNGAENITDQQVQDAIDLANLQYAGGEGGYDTQIRFRLAKIDPYGGCSGGIIRKFKANPTVANYPDDDLAIRDLSRWPTDKYLNIWVIKDITAFDASGYVRWPITTNDPTIFSIVSALDGIIIRHDFMGVTGTASGHPEFNTLAHEMGHYLFLYHVWGPDYLANTFCHPNSEGTTKGDLVADTPPLCCTITGSNCSGSQNTCHLDSPDLPDPVENYMSYSHECEYAFTEGQADRMRDMICNLRPNLIDSENQLCTGIVGNYSDVIITQNTQNKNWTTSNLPNNGEITVSGDVVIEEGQTLAIGSGVIVHFCGNGRLIIKPNARLSLSGTLTNLCDNYWQGVQVWGNSQSSQFPALGTGAYAQGRLNCNSGSLIENALVGARLYGSTNGTGLGDSNDPGYTLGAGGIITGNGATFKNNFRAVDIAPFSNFWPYSGNQLNKPRDYRAGFSNCTFETNEDYLSSLPMFHSFLYMKGVVGVGITGCDFINNKTSGCNSVMDYGYGIHASDAGFRVGAGCSAQVLPCPAASIDKTTFKNLGSGIYAASLTSNRPYTVFQAYFENCYFGIRNLDVHGMTIVENDFKLGNLPSTNVSTDQFGLFIENDILDWQVQQNKFFSNGGSSGITMVGSYCKKTGIVNKAIRNNKYHYLNFGNIAEEANSGAIGGTGLQYFCNENIGGLGDDFSVLSNSTINIIQGSWGNLGQQKISSGNTFSHNSVDFRNDGPGYIQYHYLPSNPPEVPITFFPPPPIMPGSLFVPSVANTPADCSLSYCLPPCKTEGEIASRKSDFYNYKNSYTLARSQYLSTISSGNTTLAEQKKIEYISHLQNMEDAGATVNIHLAYDTLNFNADTSRLWINNMNSYGADVQIALQYAIDGDATAASNKIQAISSKYNVVSQEGINDLLAINQMIRILDSKKSPFYLDSSSVQLIKSLADANLGYSSSVAQNIVETYGIHYSPSYRFPEGGSERGFHNNVELGEGFVKVYPNPASNQIFFEKSGFVSNTPLTLKVSDLTGQLIYNGVIENNSLVLDAKNIQSGIYFFEIFGRDKFIQSGKVLVVK